MTICSLADQPALSGATTSYCAGGIITISLDTSHQLNDELTWSLLANSCTDTILMSDTSGVFEVRPTETTTYYVRGTGCSSASPCGSITVQVVDLRFDYQVVHESTGGDGVIHISNARGGMPLYQYSIDNGVTYQSDTFFSSLSAGDYPIRIMDSTGAMSSSPSTCSIYWKPVSGTSFAKVSNLDSFSNSCYVPVENSMKHVQVDETGDRLYCATNTSARMGNEDIASASLDGQDIRIVYQTGARVRSMALVPAYNEVFYGTDDYVMMRGTLDGQTIALDITGNQGSNISDIVYSRHQDALLYMVDDLAQIWRINRDGSSKKKLARPDRLTYQTSTLALDDDSQVLYIGSSRDEILAFDLNRDTIYTVISDLSNTVEDIEFSPSDSLLYFVCNHAGTDTMYSVRPDGSGLRVLTTSFAGTRPLAVGSDAVAKVGGPVADAPLLRAQPFAQPCSGLPVVISVDPSTQLNGASTWVLYKDDCGQGRVAESTTGTFQLQVEGFHTYYVRGEGDVLGPCGTIQIGDTTPPSISCIGADTLHFGNSQSSTIIELVPGTTTQSGFDLAGVATNFEQYAPFIAQVVPNQFLFELDEGYDGATYISDGGEDMYEDGNYLNTNYASEIPYTGGRIVMDSSFGLSGAYFTRFRNGLFLLGANMDSVSYFNIDGELGTDGEGTVRQRELQMSCGGSTYRGYVKMLSDGYGGAYDLTVNHIMVLKDNDGASHKVYDDLEYEDDYLNGLHGADELYYLLFATRGGSHDLTDIEAEQLFILMVQSLLCQSTVADNCGQALLYAARSTALCGAIGSQVSSRVLALHAAYTMDTCLMQAYVLDTVAPTITILSDTTANDSALYGACVAYHVVTPINGERYATSVLNYSSQYSPTSWSAAQAIGAPNVYPSHGDITGANTFVVQDASGNADTASFYVHVMNSDSTCCDQVVNADGRPMDAGVYISSTAIHSSGIIQSPDQVTLQAGQYVDLLPTFELKLGAQLNVIIDDCTSVPAD